MKRHITQHQNWLIIEFEDYFMRSKSTLLAGILAGMSASASIYASPNYPKLIGTDTERLRGDIKRVGRHFSTVIDRENDKHKTK
jgi:hypothetical protein